MLDPGHNSDACGPRRARLVDRLECVAQNVAQLHGRQQRGRGQLRRRLAALQHAAGRGLGQLRIILEAARQQRLARLLQRCQQRQLLQTRATAVSCCLRHRAWRTAR